MYTSNPSQGEHHYLQILLHHIPGAQSYADLKTCTDGVIHNTFKDTALALGLLESDEGWDECLLEAAMSYMPKQLCSLFVTILIFGEPAKPVVLWERYREMMGEDVLRHIPTHVQMTDEDWQLHVDNQVLLLLQEELEEMGTCLERFGLPTPNKQNRIQRIPKVILEEMFDVENQKEISNFKFERLNEDQQNAFCNIMKAVHDKNHLQ